MLICGLTLGNAPFNCGYFSMGVHVLIPGSCLPNYVPLLRHKSKKCRHNFIILF